MTTGLIAEQPKPTALFVLTTPNLLCIPKKSLDSPNTETFKRLGLPGDPIEFASQSQRGQLSFPAYLSIHSTSNSIHTVRWEFNLEYGKDGKKAGFSREQYYSAVSAVYFGSILCAKTDIASSKNAFLVLISKELRSLWMKSPELQKA